MSRLAITVPLNACDVADFILRTAKVQEDLGLFCRLKQTHRSRLMAGRARMASCTSWIQGLAPSTELCEEKPVRQGEPKDQVPITVSSLKGPFQSPLILRRRRDARTEPERSPVIPNLIG
jgi:hypothetical protein